jgi:two-component system chemotaxis response regulator CheY
VKKALVVDDSSTMRGAIAQILRGQGYEVAGEAGDADRALSLYDALHPDLVTMDIVMPCPSGEMHPETAGLEAVRLIRQRDPGARIIVISAMTQKDYVAEAIRAGARDFVPKPFNPMRLREALSRAESAA